jgi:hypothetical protein
MSDGTNHAYRPNGLGAHDENGSVPCAQCGLPEGVHRDDRHFIVPVCGNCKQEIEKGREGWFHVSPSDWPF